MLRKLVNLCLFEYLDYVYYYTHPYICVQSLSMKPRLIRYQQVLLLFLAALAMVMNPIWHAMSHGHVDHHGEIVDCNAGADWTQEDLCPYCDAVSQLADAAREVSAIAAMAYYGEVASPRLLDSHLRFPLATRLRAPPLVA